MSTVYQSGMVQNEADAKAEVRKIAEYLDSKFTLPFGWKIGWDGILGLIPGIGDVLTTAFSFYIIYKAALIGCPPSVILRMGLNVLIDNVLDAIPLIGNIFDFMWKSNIKNVQLMDRFLAEPHQTTLSSRAVVLVTLLFVCAVFIACIIFTFYLATWLLGFFKAW